MLLSIIIPIYNIEKYIKECIESVKKIIQVNNDIEVIFVNDGSTDNSERIIASEIKDIKNIFLLNKENGGLSDARNFGIEKANGDYIFFLDGDDFIEVNNFIIFINYIRNSSLNCYFMTSIIEIPSMSKKWKNSVNCYQIERNKFRKNVFFKTPYQAAWLFVLKKDFILKNKLFFIKGLIHEDEEWMPRVLLNLSKNENVGVFNQPVYCYRTKREGSIVNTGYERHNKSRFTILKEFCEMLSTVEENEDRKFLCTRIAQLYRNLKNHGYVFDNYNEKYLQKILCSTYFFKYSLYSFWVRWKKCFCQ